MVNDSPIIPESKNSFDSLSALPNQDNTPVIPSSHDLPASSAIPTFSDLPKDSVLALSPASTSSANPSNEKGHKVISMESDSDLALSVHQQPRKEDQAQPTHMEEEPESIDLGDLDILGLETACRQKDFSTIPPRQLESLEVVLARAQQHKCLGIQAGSPWDGKRIMKESKKRGRRTDLQRTIIIGEMLVDSGRFPKLTKFYKTIPHRSS